jgi:glucokinase
MTQPSGARRAVPLGVTPPGIAALGVDIGGTKIVAAVLRPDGTTGPEARAATPAAEGPQAVLDAAIAAGRAAIAQAGCPAPSVCGVGTAGTVGPGGVIGHATDSLPGWTGTGVAAAFCGALNLPVTVLNDVHAAAAGESACGAARGYDDALVVYVGTGIGGGLICGGQLRTGRTSSAGAVGHLPAPRAAGRRCGCGGLDHLEAYASGPAIVASYLEHARSTATDTTADAPAGLPEIAALARSGDAVARLAIEQAAEVLGAVLGGLANILDPDVVVIGGGVAALADLLIEPVSREFRDRALPGPATCDLAFSTLGPLAVVIGAARAAALHGTG